MNKESIYHALPVPIQNVLINIEAYRIKRRRFDKDFRGFLDFYNQSDPKQTDIARLKFFMKEALAVRYWHEQFEKFDVNVCSDDPINELKKLPILEKEYVRDNQQLFINKKYLDSAFWSHTSGTTGSALCLPITYEMENRQWAVWTRYRQWHGIKQDTWMGWFGGKSVVDVKKTNPPYWRTNIIGKQLMFSAYHLNNSTVLNYHDALKKARISWLHGYPSQLALLANLIKENNLERLPDLRIITVGAENLLATQLEIMNEVFSVPIRQHYGLAEGVANISETTLGELIPDQDFCLMEFLGTGDEDLGRRKIVGTNYNNLAFPLFRYDTGDLATVEEENDSIKVLSIDGREEDYVTLPNGVKVGRLDHIFKKLRCIKEAQLIQTANGTLIIKVVPNHHFDKGKDEAVLLREARLRLGYEIDIEVEYTELISRTKSGKLRFVISEMNNIS